MRFLISSRLLGDEARRSPWRWKRIRIPCPDCRLWRILPEYPESAADGLHTDSAPRKHCPRRSGNPSPPASAPRSSYRLVGVGDPSGIGELRHAPDPLHRFGSSTSSSTIAISGPVRSHRHGIISIPKYSCTWRNAGHSRERGTETSPGPACTRGYSPECRGYSGSNT